MSALRTRVVPGDRDRKRLAMPGHARRNSFGSLQSTTEPMQPAPAQHRCRTARPARAGVEAAGNGDADPHGRWRGAGFRRRAARQLRPSQHCTPRPHVDPAASIGTRQLSQLLQGQDKVLSCMPMAPRHLPGAQAAARPRRWKLRRPGPAGVRPYLRQATGGDTGARGGVLRGPQCWGSYNAALRAINMGFRNVHWYRGGIGPGARPACRCRAVTVGPRRTWRVRAGMAPCASQVNRFHARDTGRAWAPRATRSTRRLARWPGRSLSW